jgi:glycosyltransferase involved in cell wall biosynthesis
LVCDHQPVARAALPPTKEQWAGIAVPALELVPDWPGITVATWGDLAHRRPEPGLNRLVLDLPRWQCRPRTLLHLHRMGWRHSPFGLRWQAYARAAEVLVPRWLRRRGWLGDGTVAASVATAFSRPLASPLPTEPQRITHYLRSWQRGGAERQAALLAGRQRQAGQRVKALVQMAALAEPATCHDWFVEADVPLQLAGGRWNPEAERHWHGLARLPWHHLPSELRDSVIDLVIELLLEPPDVLHCWVDEANVAGLIAGRLAGVPRIVLTGLGLSPGRDSAAWKPWLAPWYRAGLRFPEVSLAVISHYGADDYAEWLAVSRNRLDVVHIGFVPPDPPPTVEGIAAFRAACGVPAKAPLVIGLFRLEPGKRPLEFLEVVHQVRQRMPETHVVLIGRGSLEREIRQAIDVRGSGAWVHVLDGVPEVYTALAASQVLVLMSEAEGTPTVALEAQAVGCVPVLTDVGGCREVVRAEESGILVPLGDVAAATDAVVKLLTDPARRRALAAAGLEYVHAQFGLARYHRDVQKLYGRQRHH